MKKSFGQPVRVVKEQQVLENGRYVKKMVLTEEDPKDNFKDYSLLDFSMDHLIAIGADLQECDSQSVGFGTIDKLSSQLEANEKDLDSINK